MWALVESNNVTQVYTRPKALTIGDVNYPSNIFMLWSSSELEAIGIYKIVIDNSNFKNKEYYINTNQSFAFADSTVTATYGTATALPLDNILWTAEEETADARIFFSYRTPVAAYVFGRGFVRSEDFFSVTTSRHINKWIGTDSKTDTTEKVSQDFLNSLA